MGRCAGRIARARPSCPAMANRFAWSCVSAASVTMHPMVVLSFPTAPSPPSAAASFGTGTLVSPTNRSSIAASADSGMAPRPGSAHSRPSGPATAPIGLATTMAATVDPSASVTAARPTPPLIAPAIAPVPAPTQPEPESEPEL